MKKIRYWELSPADRGQLIKDYLAIFNGVIEDKTDKNGSVVKKGLQTRWEEWLNNYAPASILPKNVKTLIVAPFNKLVKYYEEFINLPIPKTKVGQNGKQIRSDELCELDGIFKYSHGFDSMIADFFIERAEKLGIRTCYYCEMAYVNNYEYWDQGKRTLRRQFDLDHFLPKGKCPCIGLSLFNFVPSCQVCNSRIKQEEIPGQDSSEYVLFSPSSKAADYDRNITVRLRFGTDNGGVNGRYIHFKTVKPYEKYVNFFHLEERYEFHKVEALRLNRLQKRYPDVKIRSIAKLLHYKPDIVKEDIFHLKYMKEEGRCFEKMTRDILG